MRLKGKALPVDLFVPLEEKPTKVRGGGRARRALALLSLALCLQQPLLTSPMSAVYPLTPPLCRAKVGSTTVGMQGRDQECRLLRGMVAELLIYQKESGIIVLIGGRGSGKGVLVKELQKFGKEAGLFVIKTASAEDEKKNRQQSVARSGGEAPAGRRRSAVGASAGNGKSPPPRGEPSVLEQEEAAAPPKPGTQPTAGKNLAAAGVAAPPAPRASADDDGRESGVTGRGVRGRGASCIGARRRAWAAPWGPISPDLPGATPRAAVLGRARPLRRSHGARRPRLDRVGSPPRQYHGSEAAHQRSHTGGGRGRGGGGANDEGGGGGAAAGL